MDICPGYYLRITTSDEDHCGEVREFFGLTRDVAEYYFAISNLFVDENHGAAHIFTYGEDVREDIDEIYNDFIANGKIIPDLPVDDFYLPLVENLSGVGWCSEYFGCLDKIEVFFIPEGCIKDVTSEFK